MGFVHLQVSTAFSLLESTVSIPKWAAYAKQLQYDTLAITDRNTMYGVFSFYKMCRENDIKPIIGLTADVMGSFEQDKAYPLVLLAKNNIGYQNLLKISSVIQTRPEPGILTKWLRSYSEGLFALTPGLEGEIEQAFLRGDADRAEEIALRYRELFGPDFYLSLQNHGTEQEQMVLREMHKLSKKLNVPEVVTSNVKYLKKEDAFGHECLLAIKAGMKLSDENRPRLSSHEYDFKPRDEMERLFSGYPEALENTEKIAHACHVEIKTGQRLLPKFPVENGKTADEFLEAMCRKGLLERVPDPSSEYFGRLEYELKIIKEMQFSDYFLIVWDFMKYAREHHILTGPGRGSAAGSLVAYVLKITDVDPIRYGLLFERFLNPERVSMPDIDSDFPDHRRDEMIRYVAGKYGRQHVAQIITFGTFAAKAAARDVARIFGLEAKELEQLSRLIPSQPGMTLQKAYEVSTPLREWIGQSERNRKLFQTALLIEGLPRHVSTHAAGVIISREPLANVIPVQEGHDGIFLTQYPMNHLEEIGLLKMDFLGLRNLTILEHILSGIEKGTGKKIHLQDLQLDDAETFRLLSSGNTTGVFQLESDGMRKVLQKLKPTEFEDIVAVNALYRPGPMENITVYIERKHGLKPVEYPHDDLKPILEKTYGVIVYQEQIMQIASRMAGFTLGEADLLRRAVSKKKKDVLDEERLHFINGARKKGYEEKTANTIYDFIVRFANYGFNRSHAVAYSMIAYQLAYLKAHYPLYFMASLLSSVIGNEDKIAQYIREAQLMGIRILPPSIQHSRYPFSVEKGAIRYSLAAIKGIGYASIKELIRERKHRPFKSLFDLVLRVRGLNRKILEAFTLSGALDEFGKDRAVLLASIDIALEHAEIMKPQEEQEDLFLDDEMFRIEPNYVETEPISLMDKLAFEKQYLGLYLSGHPAKQYRPEWEKANVLPVGDLRVGMRKILAGAYIADIRTIRTKTGGLMAFLHMNDETGDIECVVFPDVFKKYSPLCQKDVIVVVEGNVETRKGKIQVIAQKLYEAGKFHGENTQTLYMKIPALPNKNTMLMQVKRVLGAFPGHSPVILYYEGEHRTIRLPEKNWVRPDQACLAKLEQLLGEGNVILK
ncbi:DNA polymerase III subunit alpha [Weizmannia acidilactici]|uniref:DNA polymerase III subunit alpha n=1 Tax=Weizmannia acidilactici TaxID=2607726 RepID=UPI00124D585D|nr:DNA polymerase III subunit alpha [Weizmannia acidilactici]GER67007.1 DNA polymerase III subunit alpha [Weizmannia acidilactici]